MQTMVFGVLTSRCYGALHRLVPSVTSCSGRRMARPGLRNLHAFLIFQSQASTEDDDDAISDQLAADLELCELLEPPFRLEGPLPGINLPGITVAVNAMLLSFQAITSDHK